MGDMDQTIVAERRTPEILRKLVNWGKLNLRRERNHVTSERLRLYNETKGCKSEAVSPLDPLFIVPDELHIDLNMSERFMKAAKIQIEKCHEGDECEADLQWIQHKSLENEEAKRLFAASIVK